MIEMPSKKKIVMYILIGLVGIFVCLIYYNYYRSKLVDVIAVSNTTGDVNITYTVTVSGAVVAPGVYDFPPETKVIEAIEAAGGFLEEASKEGMDLLAFVKDGKTVFVPEIKIEHTPVDINSSENEPVNINSDEPEELMRLPGVGRQTANNIIAYRNNAGDFLEIEELLNVSGIGKVTYEKIKPFITVE